MRSATNRLLRSARNTFNVIEEFSTLSPKRKLLLCDHLFTEGYDTFESTVKLLWPQAADQDVKKLEKFIVLLKQTAH